MPITWRNVTQGAGNAAVGADLFTAASTNFAGGSNAINGVLDNEVKRREDNTGIRTDNNTLAYKQFLNQMSPEQLAEAQASGAVQNQLGQYGRDIDQDVALNGFNNAMTSARGEFNAGVTYDKNVRDKAEQPIIEQFRSAIAGNDDAAVAELTAANPNLSNLGALTNDYTAAEETRRVADEKTTKRNSTSTLQNTIQNGINEGLTERDIRLAVANDPSILAEDRLNVGKQIESAFADSRNLTLAESTNYNSEAAGLEQAAVDARFLSDQQDEQAQITFDLNHSFNKNNIQEISNTSNLKDAFMNSGFDVNPIESVLGVWDVGDNPLELIQSNLKTLRETIIPVSTKDNNGKTTTTNTTPYVDFTEGELNAIGVRALDNMMANNGSFNTENLEEGDLTKAFEESASDYVRNNLALEERNAIVNNRTKTNAAEDAYNREAKSALLVEHQKRARAREKIYRATNK